MKAKRWVFVAAALALVALVAPAIGQGRSAAVSLVWSQPGGPTIKTYDYATLRVGSSASVVFRLKNTSLKRSGKLAISLTGSTAFSITSNSCTGKSLVPKKVCRVTVAYKPSGVGAKDGAMLTATRPHKAAVSLGLSGSGASASGHVYWINQGDNLANGSVNVVPFSGGSVTTLASSQRAPWAVALDSTRVYWVNWGDGTLNSGTVKSVPIGGGIVTTLASGQNEPTSLAVDGAYVYWVNNGDGTVKKVPLGGGSVITLASGQAGPYSVVVDSTHVYWVNSGGTLDKLPLGGGSVTTLASGQNNPHSLAVDGTRVYWVNWGDGTVRSVPLGGGTVTTLATDGIEAASVAVDGKYVYWVNTLSGTVKKVPLGGGKTITLFRDVTQQLISVAVDATHVYWGSAPWRFGNDTVNELQLGGSSPLADGSATVLASHQTSPRSLAVGP